METYDFTLIIEGGDVLETQIMSALLAQCDDVVVGHRQGEQFADFDRQAESLEQAVASATRDVEAVPGLKVKRSIIY